MKTIRVIFFVFGAFFLSASILGMLFDGSWISPAAALLLACVAFLALCLTFIGRGGWEVAFEATRERVGAYLRRIFADAYHDALPHMGAGGAWAGGAARALGRGAYVSFMAHMSVWLGVIATLVAMTAFWWSYASPTWDYIHLALGMSVVAVACFIHAADGFPTLRRLAWEYILWVWLVTSIVMCTVAYGHMSHDDVWEKLLFASALSTLLSLVTVAKGWKKVGRVLFRQEGNYVCAIGWSGVLFLVGAFFFYFVRRAYRFDWIDEEVLAILNWGTTGTLFVMGCILFTVVVVSLKKPSDRLAKKLLGTHD